MFSRFTSEFNYILCGFKQLHDGNRNMDVSHIIIRSRVWHCTVIYLRFQILADFRGIWFTSDDSILRSFQLATRHIHVWYEYNFTYSLAFTVVVCIAWWEVGCYSMPVEIFCSSARCILWMYTPWLSTKHSTQISSTCNSVRGWHLVRMPQSLPLGQYSLKPTRRSSRNNHTEPPLWWGMWIYSIYTQST